ncbi:hypothetical protein HPCPY6311_0869 [Helicobacter pylori CPY6311]|nr:hypothetical protein HPCPY6311_0869 [Helicobacter pylori CPY6311]
MGYFEKFPLQPTTKNSLKNAFLRGYGLIFFKIFLIVKNALNIF